MDLSQAWRSAPLGSWETHAEALTLTATRLLRAGEPREAYAFIDRRCRIGEKPKASEFAIRALAASLLGWADAAREDLAKATAADPHDPFVAMTSLRLARGRSEVLAAAESIVASRFPPIEALRAAVARIVGDPETSTHLRRAVARLNLMDGRLSGWIAFPLGKACTLAIESGDAIERIALTSDPSFAYCNEGPENFVAGCTIDFRLASPPDAFRVVCEDRVLCEERLFSRSRKGPLRADLSASRRAPDIAPPRAPLTIVVPVHSDFEATQACLAAAATEASTGYETRLVVVDDASPDRRIRLLLDALAARGTIELRRNERNLGFVGAVQRGFEGAEGRDVLLLNADAILPTDGLVRLADAAYGASDIGTVTPLSNNGEYAGFPSHGRAHPVPSREEWQRIDAVAARINAGRAIDLPTGVGFCLFIRHDCHAAIGGLSSIYARGYFEDAEFCLRARRAGFRNVCAPSLYVIHHGSLSFKGEKRALVSANLGLLRQRFPGVEAECTAYVSADPMAHARRAIEAEIAPLGRPWLVAAPEGSGVASERMRQHLALGRHVVRLTWTSSGGRTIVRLRGAGGLMPQSLDFDLAAEAEHLACYLLEMAPAGVEVGGAPLPPPALIEAIAEAASLPDILVGDFSLEDVAQESLPPMLGPVLSWCHSLGERRGLAMALDRASLAALKAHLPTEMHAASPILGSPRDATCHPSAARQALGVVMAAPTPEGDAFVSELSHALRRRSETSRIVVLGDALDPLGLMGRANVFVTGQIDPNAYAATADHYGLGALVLPPSSAHLAHFERVTSETGLPFACIDWSRATPTGLSSHLLLEPSALVRDHCAKIIDWFADRLAASTPDQP